MACRLTTSNSSDTKSGACFCRPSCQLFPRRSDGKVVLPAPLNMTGKEDTVSPPSRFPKEIQPTGPDKTRVVAERKTSSKAQPFPESEGKFSAQTRHLERPSSSMKSGGHPSSSTKSVENYAQLSSLPEFKAFKLNQEDGSSDHRESNRPEGNGSSVSKEMVEKQEWMREIRVTRRTKKQSYVRSGTHDFCIRLYTGQEED